MQDIYISTFPSKAHWDCKSQTPDYAAYLPENDLACLFYRVSFMNRVRRVRGYYRSLNAFKIGNQFPVFLLMNWERNKIYTNEDIMVG